MGLKIKVDLPSLVAKLGLGAITGKKPKEVLTEEALAIAAAQLQAAGVSLLSEENRAHIASAIALIGYAKRRSKDAGVLAMLSSATDELGAVK